MSLKRFDRFKDFEDVKAWHKDVSDNLSFDDLRSGQIQTAAPTTDDLSSGKFRFVELSGVPYLYYRNISGALYRVALTAV